MDEFDFEILCMRSGKRSRKTKARGLEMNSLSEQQALCEVTRIGVDENDDRIRSRRLLPLENHIGGVWERAV